MPVNNRKGFCQKHSKSKRQFKISEENVIRSIPAYDIVIGKRKDKAVRLFYRQKPTKENVKGDPPCVVWHNCTVPKLFPYSKPRENDLRDRIPHT